MRIIDSLNVAAYFLAGTAGGAAGAFGAAGGVNPDWILRGWGRCSDCARAIAQKEWNSGALG